MWYVFTAAAIFLACILFFWRSLRLAWNRPCFDEARRAFHWQREHLEAKFVQLAQCRGKPGRGKPDGPRWSDCRFDDDVAFVRNRYTGELSAFVAIDVSVERCGHALETVGNPQAATAVFRFEGGRWETDGRAIFNLSPSETIRFYRRDLDIIEEDLAQRR
jgi:hypothetical protein